MLNEQEMLGALRRHDPAAFSQLFETYSDRVYRLEIGLLEDETEVEITAELDRAIATLPPKLKAVFMLREIEGLSTKECAEVLEISDSAAKVRLHRARLLLREQLAMYFTELVV